MPHSDTISVAVDRAVMRARLLVAAEAAAAGAAVAAWSIAAGVVVAVSVAVWRGQHASRRSVLRALEREDPLARNVIVTADELASGALRATASIRQRVDADASTLLSTIGAGAIFPVKRLVLLTLIAVVVWSVAAVSRSTRRPTAASGLAAPTESSRPGSASALQVTVRVEPPAYTHLGSAVAIDPSQIDAVERADVQLSIAASSSTVTIDNSGDVRRLERGANGSFDHRFAAMRSGYVLVITGDGARRMMPLSIKVDALPVVRITAPGRDLVYDGGNASIGFTAHATDDFGLRTLTLRFTKVSGSGEQFAFTEGEIPLVLARQGDRDWSGTARRTLHDLALAEGDMLVYRAAASDMRPGSVEAISDAFYIEVSKLGIAAGDAFTLPEQETRYALSQQMLIVKTERLNQRRSSMAVPEILEASQSLAVEQRMIRSEFVFMLGGEIEDEEVEAEQSVEIQAGRLLNRGQRDIRAATVAMSQAEKYLTGANTADALKAERAAVEALQRAFARDRYILRALASRSQLDLTRRLTGSISDVIGWHRALDDAPPNRLAVALQSLIQGLGEASSREQVEVLAEFAVRADADSSALREVAAELQKLADTWSTIDARDRSDTLDAIAERVALEARRVLADPPANISGAR